MVATEAPGRIELLDLPLLRLEQELARMGEKPFRARQIFQWLYRRGARDFAAMTDLPQSLRRRLAAEARIGLPEVFRVQISRRDGTAKYLLRLADGELVESVFLPHDGRATACLSTQVGCAMACAFCATGESGFARHLRASEIVGQVLAMEHQTGLSLDNLVYMGMGEPLHNYEAVRDSLLILLSPQGRCWSPRRITLSTCGLVPGIRRLAEDGLKVRLAVSLHAPDDETRARLIPVNRRYPLRELMQALRDYQRSTGLQLTFEYALFHGVNDSESQARAVARLIRGFDAKLNLIPYNPVPGLPFQAPPFERVVAFQRILKQAGWVCIVRTEKGGDIDAACGQLRRRSA